MADLKPFFCVRPRTDLADRIAALPYDVCSREEACAEVERNPYSFLKIDRAETQFDADTDMYSDEVYEKAKNTLDTMIQNGEFIQEDTACFYIYELTMNGRSQTGLVACASIDDYINNHIKKHENTKTEKELDRIRHVDACCAQTGPIFLAYRENKRLSHILSGKKSGEPLYLFTSNDGITHAVWKIDEPELIAEIQQIFQRISEIYIADGHHRAASAVRTGLKRRQEAGSYTGNEEFNYFLSVLFPDNELMIMDYNRYVLDLNGYTPETLIDRLKDDFDVRIICDGVYKPDRKGRIGMYVNHTWYCLTIKETLAADSNPVDSLDVAYLQNKVLAPLFNIQDPKTDKRIDFIGGIRGLSELEKLVDNNGGVAFAMYPTGMAELFAVADAGLLMPPKSTWFEPKLRSGLFIHQF